MNAADRRLALETVAATALILALIAAVSAATDEPSSNAATRAARLLALGPLACAVGVALTLRRRQLRGETAALMALGQTPTRSLAGAHVAGWLLGGLCALGLLTPWVDTAALFPVVVAEVEWTITGTALLEPVAGVRVDRDLGLMLVQGAGADGSQQLASKTGSALLVGPLAAVAPPWATAALSRVRRVITLAASAALGVVLLHMVAAGHVSAAWLVAAALPLGIGAGVGHRRIEWSAS